MKFNIQKTIYAKSIFVVSQKSILKFENSCICKCLNSLKDFKHHMTSQNDALLDRIYVYPRYDVYRGI